jgi:hypothetical protein
LETGRDGVLTFSCPYLNSEVELTLERERHIAGRHPDLLPEYEACMRETLLDPDAVRQSPRVMGARMFSKWYNDVKGGKHVVVVVMSSAGTAARSWVITAYLARRLAGGAVEWKKD